MDRRKLLSFGPLAILGSLLGIRKVGASPAYVPVLITDPQARTYTGSDGTFFAMEALARTRDSLDYMIKAYTTNQEYYYRRIEFPCMWVQTLAPNDDSGINQALNEHLDHAFAWFIKQYYNNEFVKDTPSNLSFESKFSWDV